MWNPFSDATEGAIKGLGSAVAEAVGAFRADPTKVVEFELAINKATLDFQTRAMEAVNATMQAESKSEHWMQWSWRPSIGFTFAGILVNNYILLPYLAPLGVVAIIVPDRVWEAILVVLGAAAAGRSWEKWGRPQGK